MHPSATCSFFSLLIRSSIVFITSVVGDGVEAAVLSLEDAVGVAATGPVVEVTGGVVAAESAVVRCNAGVVAAEPAVVACNAGVLDAEPAVGGHKAEKKAEVAAAAFLCAEHAGSVSRRSLLEAVVVSFDGGAAFL